MKDYLYNLATDRKQGLLAAIFKVLLFILSLVYGAIVRSLTFFYQLKPRCLGCKVVSVGNITLGGTGKTLLVEYIAKYLQSQGRKIAILSRGYKKSRGRQEKAKINYEAMGDEPYMLSRKLGNIPVLADKDRIKLALQARHDYSVDTVLLDDGFQQWRINKDLEILAIDAGNPFGNRHMLPRGILREPLSSLKRADVFFLTKINLALDFASTNDYLARANPRALIVESTHSPAGFYLLGKPLERLDPVLFQDKPACLLSGIADPVSFERLVSHMGIKPGLSIKFPDHHNYTQADLDKVVSLARDKGIDIIITTEKDAVKLDNLALSTYNLQLLVLHIELKITKNEEEFHSRLLKLYSA